jgi:hypothetical protein
MAIQMADDTKMASSQKKAAMTVRMSSADRREAYVSSSTADGAYASNMHPKKVAHVICVAKWPGARKEEEEEEQEVCAHGVLLLSPGRSAPAAPRRAV